MKRKFGELVRDVKVSVDRANNPYEFYVAGDHMDSEDFRIHRKGCFATDDVGPAFIRVFRPGQVLYGSRRTYLKKVRRGLRGRDRQYDVRARDEG